jgi:phosphoglycolate phosphatase-like HAD superfamily hydrolase
VIHYLFDIDGTLIKAGGAGARSLSKVMLAKYGVTDATRGVPAAGRTDPAIVHDMFERALGRKPDVIEVVEVIDAYLETLDGELGGTASTLRVLPGAVESLRWLAARPEVRLAVATGNVRRGAHIKLQHAGLAGHFDLDRTGGYGCDSAVRAELVARAVERAACGDGDHVVVVGDTVHDVSAALAVGARCVAVTTGGISAQILRDAGACHVLDDVGGLPGWHTAQFA